MDVIFENENGGARLVADEAGLSLYAEAVLAANVISGLIPLRVRISNNKKQYCYDVGGKISLEKFCSRRLLSLSELEFIIKSLAGLPETLEEYLLDEDCIALAPEFIFVDERRQKCEYCLLKTDEKGYYDGIRDIMAYLLRKIDHSDEACSKTAYELFELTANDGYAPEELTAVFEKNVEPVPEEDSFDIPDISIEGYGEPGTEPCSEYKLTGDRKIIAEYEVEDVPAPDWLTEKKNLFPDISAKKIIAVLLPAFGLIGFVFLFAFGLMNGLPLWMKIICPGLVMSSLILVASALWPKSPQ